MGLFLNFLLILVILYALIAAGLYLFQRKLIYLPAETPDYSKYHGLENVELLRLPTSDGLHLVTWHLKGDPALPTIVYFHGNAGTLMDRADKYATLNAQGFSVIAPSWRGYSGNEGSPSEEGLYTDARAAITYAHSLGIPDDRIVLYGESLGSGVAVQMATEITPAALILEAPYTAVSDRAAELYPWIPVRLLIKDHFNSLSKIGKINSPLLIMHGTNDETIPVAHGKKLLEAAPTPKKGVFILGAGHVDFDLEEVAREVKEFVNERGLIKRVEETVSTDGEN